MLAALVTTTQPEAPLIMWLYALLSIFYLPAVANTWYRQSRQAQLAPQTRGIGRDAVPQDCHGRGSR
jgi:hypothetical protein